MQVFSDAAVEGTKTHELRLSRGSNGVVNLLSGVLLYSKPAYFIVSDLAFCGCTQGKP